MVHLLFLPCWRCERGGWRRATEPSGCSVPVCPSIQVTLRITWDNITAANCTLLSQFNQHFPTEAKHVPFLGSGCFVFFARSVLPSRSNIGYLTWIICFLLFFPQISRLGLDLTLYYHPSVGLVLSNEHPSTINQWLIIKNSTNLCIGDGDFGNHWFSALIVIFWPSNDWLQIAMILIIILWRQVDCFEGDMIDLYSLPPHHQ